jgi:hypothetical protein
MHIFSQFQQLSSCLMLGLSQIGCNLTLGHYRYVAFCPKASSKSLFSDIQ